MLHKTVIVVWIAALAVAATVALLAGDSAPPGGGLLWAATSGERAAETSQTLAARGVRPRPSDVPPGPGVQDDAPPTLALFNDYTTPERTHGGEHAVVHYVTSGVSAPPLNDDDGDRVPDYVERVAEAADAAVDYYLRRGFGRIRPDAGGPDGRPDVYVTRFAAGTFGVAIPEREADGGAFVAIANGLDPSRTEALGSLDGTVAHELFHLVQFSYFGGRDVELPDWVLEGTAAAMERRLYPDAADIVAALQLRRWLAAPHRSLTTQSYGAQLLWAYLDARHPRLLPEYLARLAARPPRGGGAEELVGTFARVAHRPFAPVFHRFVLAAAAEHGPALRAVRTVGSGVVGETVPPLAVHYVRLHLPPDSAAATVRLVTGAPALRATLAYELESETAGEPSEIVRASRRSLRGGVVVFRIPAAVRRSARFARPLLVVSNGSGARRAAYRLSVS